MAQLEKLKLTANVWDSDKDPTGFTLWLDTFSSLVRATDHGAPLEDFITYKTGREVFVEASVPSFLLNDPDFMGVPVAASSPRRPTPPINKTDSVSDVPQSASDTDAAKRRLFTDPSTVSFDDLDALRTGVTKVRLKKSPTTYMELPEASRSLDGLLYNVLKMVVKGSKSSLLTCVMFPSYVQAVCVMISHMDISKYDRIIRAIFGLDQLTFNGDVHVFQVKAMSVIREVRASKANITHLILTRLMRAFEGKSKTVQYKIAEIINSGVEIDETLNLYDIIQSLCSDIATVGDVKASVNSVTDDVKCNHCGYNHKTEDCRKLKALQRKTGASGEGASFGEPGSFKGTCHKCGVQGHTARFCPSKKSTVATAAAAPAAAPEAAPVTVPVLAEPVIAPGKQISFSASQLSDIMGKIQRGEATVSLARPTPRTRQTARKDSGQLPPRLSKGVQHSTSLLADGQPFGEYNGNRVLLLSDSSSSDMSIPALVTDSSSSGADSSDDSDPVRQTVASHCTDLHHRWESVVLLVQRWEQVLGRIEHCQAYVAWIEQSQLHELTVDLQIDPIAAQLQRDLESFHLQRQQPTVELDHPHTSSLLSDGQPFGEYNGNRVCDRIAMSLCNGIGGCLFALNVVGAVFDRVICVEKDNVAKVVCDNVNDGCRGPNVADNTWASDVWSITEDMIKGLGRNAIRYFSMGPPCQDHSKLRLIPRRGQKSTVRPGFDGRNGKTFRMCLLVFCWVMLYNPDCEYFCEHLDFSDMPSDWAQACNVLGQPVIVVSDSCSYTRRRRAYWTNFVLPDGFGCDFQPLDPDDCMDEGRTLVKYQAYGKDCVYPLGASWYGPHDNPIANTRRPLLVRDVQHDALQQLRVHEAEKLMGYPPHVTAGQGVTIKQRLQRVGNGWDMNVVVLFHAHSKHARLNVAAIHVPALLCVSAEDELIGQGLRAILHQDGSDALVSCLVQYEHSTQLQMLSLLQHACVNDEVSTPAVMLTDANWSVLDSGSSRHLHPRSVVTDADHSISLSGFDRSQQWTEGCGYLPVEFLQRETGGTVAYDVDCVDHMSNLMHPILSLGKLVRQGFSFYVGDYGRDMYAVAPGSSYTIKLELGVDDILRIPHSVRTGSASAPLPSAVLHPAMKEASCVELIYECTQQCTQGISAVTRTMKSANGVFLHEMLNHVSAEKIYHTLSNTKGFKPIRFDLPTCVWCALGKSVRTGLSHQRHQNHIDGAAPAAPESLLVSDGTTQYVIAFNNDCVYDDSDDGDLDDHCEWHDEMEYESPSAGRMLGEQSVPRYDLSKLRPFEVMFADNKDYPCKVRGSKQVAFVLVDYYSSAKFKVDVSAKSDNGNAFRQIVAMNGIHKLPYCCHIWTDGCGSMSHVAAAASSLGIDHAYTIPREPSLNEAEKVCNFMWAAARTHMAVSKAPDYLMAEAVSYSVYVDMRTATTASRDWKTPYELIKGFQPSLVKMHRWYTKAFVNVPKAKRSFLQQQGNIDRAEPGRLIGYHSLYSTTYKVMLSKNRLVHSSNVTFEPEDRTHISPREAAMRDHSSARWPKLPASSPVTDELLPALDESTVSEDVHPVKLNPVRVNIEHCDLFDQFKDDSQVDDEYFEWTPGREEWLTHSDPEAQLQPRQRHAPDRLAFLCAVEDCAIAAEPGCECQQICNLVCSFVDNSKHVDHEAVRLACLHLAMVAHKDLCWSDILQTDDRDRAIKALKTEKDSLRSTILTPVSAGDAEWEAARKEAISGRYLLDLKRVGVWKVRGVKQGFKEDKSFADGPDFVYYAHVAKLVTVRMLLSRANRGTRRIAIKDVRVAFLQSDKFAPDIIKYISFKDPVTKVVEYFRQTGPIYGEAGAPVRWERTIAPWLVTEGFTRGENEQAVFLHESRDILLLTYVDDLCYDAEEDDIRWCDQQIEVRFDCKDTDGLEPDRVPLDYLGMELMLSPTRIHLSMQQYTTKHLPPKQPLQFSKSA
jgi:hypothetical protein